MHRPELEERTVDVGGLAFRVLASGHCTPPAHPAIVLIHGIGMSHRYLSKLHELLARDRRVFSIDLPGFGGLPKPPGDVDIPTMAAALGRVVDSLDVGPVVLIGQSMGTQWVTELGAQRPDLATDVVLIGPVADAAHRTVPGQLIALAADSLGEPPSINWLVFTDYVRCGIPWYLTQVRHMLAYRLEERVAELAVPLLVVRGSRDPIAGREWCRQVRDAAPVAFLAEVPGHHHNSQQSAPKAVASAILANTTSAMPAPGPTSPGAAGA